MFTLATVFAIFMVFFGCGCNVVFLEHSIRASTSSGNMIVFFQFLFIAAEGFINFSKFGKTKRVIPLKDHIVMVLMFFTINVSNIMAFDCNIPMPLHMIFKSGSLVANLLLGVILLKKSYRLTKYLAVIFVTVGIFISTIATKTNNKTSGNSSPFEEEKSFFTTLFGIALMMFALLLSARLGIYQEVLYKTYGKQSREALFYNHAIPLPFFIILAPSISENIAILNQSEWMPVPVITDAFTLITGNRSWALTLTSLPILWQYMVANVVTQYICIRSIFYLTTVCPSLTVTLVVTLRKFLSIVVSVMYFKNEFTSLHWLGAAFVFVGTLLYADVLSIFRIRRKASYVDHKTYKNGVVYKKQR